MDTRLAIALGSLVITAILADQVLAEGDGLVFLGRKLLELIDWLAFWR